MICLRLNIRMEIYLLCYIVNKKISKVINNTLTHRPLSLYYQMSKRKFFQKIHKRNKYERLHHIFHKHLTHTHRNQIPF